jgi:beta-phosphoglucomutase family hydrolase
VPTLQAWLFDLDGVLTDTARIHAVAWQVTFDQFLRERAQGRPFIAFDPASDYERYVDGKPRCDGVRDFLASRGVVVPEGRRSDGPDISTVWGIGNQKNARLLEQLELHGPTVFPGSVAFVRAVLATGARTAVVSASENCRPVLQGAGIAGLFEVVVDGLVASQRELAGKPAPDTYLFAAHELGVEPSQAAVVEDAPAGITAGRAGGFGWVVAVARRDSSSALEEAGADVVVHDLDELLNAPGATGEVVPRGHGA